MAWAVGRCGMPTPTRGFTESFSEVVREVPWEAPGSLGVHAEGTGCDSMGWAGLLGTQWPCSARCGACHRLPEAEWHQSGLPRLHPCQQGAAVGAGGQAASGVGAGPIWGACHPRAPHPPQMMQTNIPGVFAAGDAVTFPLAWRNSRKVNIPHWQMAHAQGTVSPEAAGGGRLSLGPGLPQARPSVAALGSRSLGPPSKALQWPVRPASHR